MYNYIQLYFSVFAEDMALSLSLQFSLSPSSNPWGDITVQPVEENVYFMFFYVGFAHAVFAKRGLFCTLHWVRNDDHSTFLMALLN